MPVSLGIESAGTNIKLSWPATAVGYQVQTTPSPVNPQRSVTNVTVEVINDRNVATLPVGQALSSSASLNRTYYSIFGRSTVGPPERLDASSPLAKGSVWTSLPSASGFAELWEEQNGYSSRTVAVFGFDLSILLPRPYNSVLHRLA